MGNRVEEIPAPPCAISLRGVSTNNLKEIDVEFLYNKMTAIVGRSGSGKTSLAFHSLYALSRFLSNRIDGNVEPYVYKIASYEGLLMSMGLKQKKLQITERATILSYFNLDTELQQLYQKEASHPLPSLFKINNPANYCQNCLGLGYTKQPDITSIISYDTPLLEGPFKTWNSFLSDHYAPLLEAFCAAHKIDINCSLNDLAEREQKLVLYSREESRYSIKYKQRQKGTIRYKNRKLSYIGPLAEIEDLIQEGSPSSEKKIENYIRKGVCHDCKGGRITQSYDQYKYQEVGANEILRLSLDGLFDLLQRDGLNSNVSSRGGILLSFVEKCVKNKLGYLSLSRSVNSLSGGEFQRLLLSNILISKIHHVLYLFDELSSSLHPMEKAPLIAQVKELKNHGATIVLVEHDENFVSECDQIIHLEAGRIRESLSASKQEILQSRDAPLERPPSDFRKTVKFKEFKVSKVHNIEYVRVKIPRGCISGICGVSGSGKSSFAESIAKETDVLYISQADIQGNRLSTIGTYLDLLGEIQKTIKELESGNLLYTKPENRCQTCEGKASIAIKIPYAARSYMVCPECEGKRYNKEILLIKYKGYSLWELLTLDFKKLLDQEIFSENIKITNILKEFTALGMGHLYVMRTTQSLSGGEAQRLKLLKNLQKKRKEIIVVDEPTKGLGKEDSLLVLSFLKRKLDLGYSLVLIEHNLLVLREMHYLIEFGKGGGPAGGEVTFQGWLNPLEKLPESKYEEPIIYAYLNGTK